MKKMLLLFGIIVFLTKLSFAQTTQISLGVAARNEYFSDTKFDPSDGSIINVGYISNLTTGNDLLIVKLNSSHNIVWQKTIPNLGDDIFYKVIVCSNGNYLAVGQLYQSGVRRAVACRISGTDGSIIWTSVSSNSSIGEVFFDVVETANHNIALAGYESFSAPQTNSFITLLNSSGTVLWSFISTRGNSDGFQGITQLPNNNLIVGGIYVENAGNYNGVILELNESNGAVISQNTYSISVNLPGNPFLLNTISPSKFFVKNNMVICQAYVFANYGSASNNCIFVYDQTTKNLSGNILYHSNTDNANAYSIYPVTETDYLVTSTYSTPQSAYISRITNGTVAFDRQVNSSVTSITSADLSGSNAVFSGAATMSGLEGYNLFSLVSLPSSTTPCDVSNSNTLFLQNQNITATSQDALMLVPGGVMVSTVLTEQDPGLTVTDVCGFLAPVQLLSFTAAYQPATNDVLLTWSTAGELNSKSFIVERAKIGSNDFIPIGSVGAGGTTNTVLKYRLTDKTPYPGINLYRLKQIDIDGKFTYSDIKTVKCNPTPQNDYMLSPVPARSFTVLKFAGTGAKTIAIDIIDAKGTVIKQQHAVAEANNPVNIDLSGSNAGIYFVKISSAGNNTVIKKLVIQ